MLINLWNKISSNPLQLLIILYFFFRLPYLSKLPIFNDEAIYLDWGQRMVGVSLPLFYSLFDGKQPLLTWLFGGVAYWANGRNPNIKPIYFDSAIINIDDVNEFELPAPLYFVAREKHLGGMDELLTEEVRYYKPDNKSYIGIYSLNRK